MKDGKSSFNAAASELLESESGAPVLPDEILAYHRGELAGEELERFLDRLARQPDAARAVADLARAPDVEPIRDGFKLTENDLHEDWARLTARLDLPMRPAPTAPRWPLALAALFLVTSLGLGLRVAQLQKLVDAPQTNVLVKTLTQGSFRAGDEPEVEKVEVPPSSPRLLFILPLRHSVDGTYRVEILDRQGTVRWAAGDLVPDAYGNLTFVLRASRLATGAYRIHILDEATDDPVATFSVELEKKGHP